jgi:hypothetical protein
MPLLTAVVRGVSWRAQDFTTVAVNIEVTPDSGPVGTVFMVTATL